MALEVTERTLAEKTACKFSHIGGVVGTVSFLFMTGAYLVGFEAPWQTKVIASGIGLIGAVYSGVGWAISEDQARNSGINIFLWPLDNWVETDVVLISRSERQKRLDQKIYLADLSFWRDFQSINPSKIVAGSSNGLSLALPAFSPGSKLSHHSTP
jgi:hypothetical protein